MTPNEVKHARAHKEKMVLFILADIQVEDGPNGPAASRGKQVVYWPWEEDGGHLEPISCMHRIPEGRRQL